MYIAMNNFKVVEGKEAEFEKTWKERESYLNDVPGFVHFALLRCEAPGEYVSHSTWEDRQAFVNWVNSEAFVKGHRQGSLAGILEGPPVIKTYDAIIEETAEGRTVEVS
jgi:heme-degrading monooxygenase HmoA